MPDPEDFSVTDKAVPAEIEGPIAPTETVGQLEALESPVHENSAFVQAPEVPPNTSDAIVLDSPSTAEAVALESTPAPRKRRVLTRLARWFQRDRPDRKISVSDIGYRKALCTAVAALSIAGCTSEGTPPPAEQSTSVKTPTPEVKKKEPIEKNFLHVVINMGEDEDIESLQAQSMSTAETALEGMELSLRGRYELSVTNGGVQNVSLTKEERAIFKNSDEISENTSENVDKATKLYYEKTGLAIDKLAEKVGPEAINQYDGILGTVVIPVDGGVALWKSVVNSDPNDTDGGEPIITAGMTLNYMPSNKDIPGIMRVLTKTTADTFSKATGINIYAHEVGHALISGERQIGHANTAICDGIYTFNTKNKGLPLEMPNEPGACFVQEFGDTTSVMGASDGDQDWVPGEMLNPAELLQLDALEPTEYVQMAAADFVGGKAHTFTIEPPSQGTGVKMVFLPPVEGEPLPVLDQNIPVGAKMHPALVFTREYNDISAQIGTAEPANYSAKVLFVPMLNGKPVGSTYAVQLTRETNDENNFNDVGAPKNYLGDVLVDREGRKVSILEYNKDGKPSVTVQISSQ